MKTKQNTAALSSKCHSKSTSAGGMSMLEALEGRRLLTAQINFPNFSSTTNLTFNGYGSGAHTIGNNLKLTDGGNYEARSVFYGTTVPIETFRTDFSFRSEAGPITADGLTFTVQGGDATQLGSYGRFLGVAGIPNSEAVAFNMFNFSTFTSTFGFVRDGQAPVTTTSLSPLNLHSGDLFHATAVYDGHNLKIDVTDARNRSERFSASKAVNLTSTVGSNVGTVGFTAGTGTNISTLQVTSWTYTGVNAPTIAVAAAADPNPVTGKTTTLSVLGADTAGESDLTYSWSVLEGSKAQVVQFSANDSNAAKATTATFNKDGTYHLRCKVTNSTGASAFSNVTVVVEQTATALKVAPHKKIIDAGTTQQYSASVLDQFNHELRTQPEISFSATGSGTINSSSGLFTASDAPGHVVVTALADELTGTVGATVVA